MSARSFEFCGIVCNVMVNGFCSSYNEMRVLQLSDNFSVDRVIVVCLDRLLTLLLVSMTAAIDSWRFSQRVKISTIMVAILIYSYFFVKYRSWNRDGFLQEEMCLWYDCMSLHSVYLTSIVNIIFFEAKILC